MQKEQAGEREYRAFTANIELRSENETPKIRGYAAVFNSLSEDLWFGQEKIAPGAFSKTIQKEDIRALWNHDPNYVLGRTKSKTLTLHEDEHGLAIEIIPPKTQWANDLLETIRRGDVDQMSFGFRVAKQDWEGTAENPIRVLREVILYDVSPVTYPAYSATEVNVRSPLNKTDVMITCPQDGHGAAVKLALLRKKLEIAESEI